jgi:RNA polymerase sigma factor (sigma-70 family)
VRIINDTKLVINLKRGNEKEVNNSLEYLYKLNFPVIERFITANSGSSEDAKDVFQDALIAFYQNLKHKDLVLTCSISTYLYSVSRNLWLKKLKRSKNLTKIEDFEDFIAVDDEEQVSKEALKVLESVFSEISEKCIKVLTYFYFDNLSMKEIGRLTGYKSEQAVKNKKYKCMQELLRIISSSRNELILRELIS